MFGTIARSYRFVLARLAKDDPDRRVVLRLAITRSRSNHLLVAGFGRRNQGT